MNHEFVSPKFTFKEFLKRHLYHRRLAFIQQAPSFVQKKIKNKRKKRHVKNSEKRKLKMNSYRCNLVVKVDGAVLFNSEGGAAGEGKVELDLLVNNQTRTVLFRAAALSDIGLYTQRIDGLAGIDLDPPDCPITKRLILKRNPFSCEMTFATDGNAQFINQLIQGWINYKSSSSSGSSEETQLDDKQ